MEEYIRLLLAGQVFFDDFWLLLIGDDPVVVGVIDDLRRNDYLGLFFVVLEQEVLLVEEAVLCRFFFAFVEFELFAGFFCGKHRVVSFNCVSVIVIVLCLGSLESFISLFLPFFLLFNLLFTFFSLLFRLVETGCNVSFSRINGQDHPSMDHT